MQLQTERSIMFVLQADVGEMMVTYHTLMVLPEMLQSIMTSTRKV